MYSLESIAFFSYISVIDNSRRKELWTLNMVISAIGCLVQFEILVMHQMRPAPRTIDLLSLLLAFRDTALFQCVVPREKHENAICRDAFQSAKAILSYATT
jgi:hypothetical protein